MEEIKLKKHSTWMTISGALAFTFFLVANLTNWFTELNLTAGIIQIMLNIFVFTTWFLYYKEIQKERFSFKKLVVIIGIIFPPLMAVITIARVIIPFITT